VINDSNIDMDINSKLIVDNCFVLNNVNITLNVKNTKTNGVLFQSGKSCSQLSNVNVVFKNTPSCTTAHVSNNSLAILFTVESNNCNSVNILLVEILVPIAVVVSVVVTVLLVLRFKGKRFL